MESYRQGPREAEADLDGDRHQLSDNRSRDAANARTGVRTSFNTFEEVLNRKMDNEEREQMEFFKNKHKNLGE